MELSRYLKDLPDLLVKERIRQGITQKELAQRIGRTEQQIQKWEYGGYQKITLAILIEVAQALGVQIG